MAGIPNYPNFKNVSLEDKNIYTEYLCKYETYSDFNLLSLLSWNSGGDNAYSFLNGNIVLKLKDYLGEKYNYSVLGSTQLESTVEELIGSYGTLKFVPEIVIKTLQTAGSYDIQPDRDSFDYILSLKNLSELNGHEYKPLRRYVSTFLRQYPGYSVHELDLKTTEHKKEIINLTKNWVDHKGFDTEKKAEEELIISKFLNLSDSFDCISVGLYVDNKLIAYTLNEVTFNNMLMGHFGKAYNQYEGCSYFIEYETAKFLYQRGYQYINHEQDTGIVGLRETKMTYRPIRFLEKYTIAKK